MTPGVFELKQTMSLKEEGKHVENTCQNRFDIQVCNARMSKHLETAVVKNQARFKMMFADTLCNFIRV